jgi:hypothetical protein
MEQERRQGDRRRIDAQILAEQRDFRAERRRRNRRRLIQAGLIALAGAAGAKTHLLHRTHMLSDPAETVEVTDEDFRVPEQDEPQSVRAMLEALAEEAAEEYDVSLELVLAVIQTESGFRPTAVSPVGALGPMQLMPLTAKALGVENPQDARENIFGGTKYLSMLLDRFNGNTALALAGYNAGPTVVARLKAIPPYGETRGYVRKIHKLVADTDAAFSLPAPKPRAKGRKVLKSRTVMARSGLKDKRASVTRASVTKKSTRSTKAKATAAKYKAPAKRARPSGSRA